MKNRIVFIGIIAVLLLVAGGYVFISTQKGLFQRNMNDIQTTQSQQNYELEVTAKPDTIDPEKPITLTYKINNDEGETLKDFETVHEKIMHFIAVRKDLAYFQHLHPEYNEATGEFTLAITFPEDGQYRIFPDFTPGVDNPQKLPFTVYADIDVGDSNKYYAQSSVPDTEQTKTYGDYSVATTFPKDMKKQQEVTYTLNIMKDGKPVTNLENYLGALGHSVILKEGSLDFIHTHAIEANDSGMNEEHGAQSQQHGGSQNTTGAGPEISFATTFPESGVYKIFTQFQHEGEIQTVDYIVKVN